MCYTLNIASRSVLYTLCSVLPALRAFRGQRWGSAMPAPVLVGGRGPRGASDTTARVADVEYESATPPLVYDRPAVAPSPATHAILTQLKAGDLI